VLRFRHEPPRLKPPLHLPTKADGRFRGPHHDELSPPEARIAIPGAGNLPALSGFATIMKLSAGRDPAIARFWRGGLFRTRGRRDDRESIGPAGFGSRQRTPLGPQTSASISEWQPPAESGRLSARACRCRPEERQRSARPGKGDQGRERSHARLRVDRIRRYGQPENIDALAPADGAFRAPPISRGLFAEHLGFAPPTQIALTASHAARKRLLDDSGTCRSA